MYVSKRIINDDCVGQPCKINQPGHIHPGVDIVPIPFNLTSIDSIAVTAVSYLALVAVYSSIAALQAHQGSSYVS